MVLITKDKIKKLKLTETKDMIREVDSCLGIYFCRTKDSFFIVYFKVREFTV